MNNMITSRIFIDGRFEILFMDADRIKPELIEEFDISSTVSTIRKVTFFKQSPVKNMTAN